MVYGGFSIDLITLSGILLTTVISFDRLEMNQSTSKIFLKSLHIKVTYLNKNETIIRYRILNPHMVRYVLLKISSILQTNKNRYLE